MSRIKLLLSLLIFLLGFLSHATPEVQCSSVFKSSSVELVTLPVYLDQAQNKQVFDLFLKGQQAFAKLARPEEYYYFPMFQEYLEWSTSSRQAVKSVLEKQRHFIKESISFDDMDIKFQKHVILTQIIMAEEFPKIFGRDLAFDARKVTLLAPNDMSGERLRYGNATDLINHKIHLLGFIFHDKDFLVRVLTHEMIHLNGRTDWALLITNFTGLREGLTEYFTTKLLAQSKFLKLKDGKIWKSSSFYKPWVRAIEEQIINVLFEGSDNVFVEYYNSGDLNHLVSKIKSAWNKNSDKLKYSKMDADTKDFIVDLKEFLDKFP